MLICGVCRMSASLGLTEVEQKVFAELVAKKKAAQAKAESKKPTPEELELKKHQDEMAKLSARVKFLKTGAYGDVADPEVLKKLRFVFKMQGELEASIESQVSNLQGRWTAPSKKEQGDFLAQLETHSTNIAIATHDLMLLFNLSPEDQNRFENEFKDGREQSAKRKRVYEKLDAGMFYFE